MQPLGLSATQHGLYVSHLLGSHNFTVRADVLTTAGAPIQAIHETLIDGQVNIQRDGIIRRTCTLTFFDPDRRLHLDPDSPFGSTLFLDRMLRVQHVTVVPVVGRVTATVFVGPVSRVSRDGDTLQVECQDKAAFGARGRPPLKVNKGMNAVAAIRKILVATGETQFRFPDQNNRRLPRAFTVGWSDEAAPWVVAQKIAALLNMQLIYSCDGYATLRRVPAAHVVTLTQEHLTGAPRVDYDATEIYNTVRVEGRIKKAKKKPNDSRDRSTKKKADTKDEKVAVTAVLKAKNPVSPSKLGRNGSGRYLPLLVTGKEFKKKSDAEAVAKRHLRNGDDQTNAGVSLSTVPLFHLDVDDLLLIDTDTTRLKLRLAEGSIPLGVSGDMSVGARRRVSARRAG